MVKINNTKNKGLILSMITFGMLLLLVNFASSFAVGSKHWEENPILVSPGETADFFVVLQNVAGEGGDLNVQGALTEGGDIASFVEDSHEYFVPFGSKKNVNLSVTIPENVTIGGIRDIVISFKITSGEGSGALGLGSSIERTIPVKVIEVPSQKSSISIVNIFVIILFLLAVIAISIIWVYKKRLNQSNPNKV